jgi:hypothetical protein
MESSNSGRSVAQESPLIGPGAWMNPFYADGEEERSSQRYARRFPHHLFLLSSTKLGIIFEQCTRMLETF